MQPILPIILNSSHHMKFYTIYSNLRGSWARQANYLKQSLLYLACVWKYLNVGGWVDWIKNYLTDYNTIYSKITPPIYHSIKSSHVKWPMSQVATCDRRGVTGSHLWHGSLNMWRFYTVIYCVPKWCHMWQLMCHRSWVEEDGSCTCLNFLIKLWRNEQNNHQMSNG